jgi:ribosomal protein S18 acetylase RimI-like enzyme
VTLRVYPAVTADIDEIADVAAKTFPLACPASSSSQDIAAFVSANLSTAHFAEYLADPNRGVFVARDASGILGYAMVIHGVPDDADVKQAVVEQPAVELSKMYVMPDAHGGMVAGALIEAAIACAHDRQARCVWLGVNQENRRAQRFYTKHGFAVSGTKTFQLGRHQEDDYVMVRPLP